MKARVFYDGRGEIQSVIRVARKAGTEPSSAQYRSLEVDLKDVNASTLAELHAGFRVDAGGKLRARSPASRGRGAGRSRT